MRRTVFRTGSASLIVLAATSLVAALLVALPAAARAVTSSARSAASSSAPSPGPVLPGGAPTVGPHPPVVAPPVVTAETQALAQAAATGRPVPIPSLNSETQVVSANPDHTVTASLYGGPTQVLRNGVWTKLDGALQAANGSVAPKVNKAPVSMSAGSSAAGPAASLGTTAGTVGLGWRSALPAPSLAGNVATYPNVGAGASSAGASLTVAAMPEGFELSLVLTAPPTGLGTVRLPVTLPVGGSLALRTGGGFQVLAADGSVAAVISPAMMWDTGHGPTTGYEGEHPVPTRVVTTPAGSTELDLTPDPAFLAAATTRYPVTIDPTVTLPDNLDTDVTNGCVTCNYDTSSDLHVGHSSPYGVLYRSFLRIDDSAIKGQTVTSAHLSLWEHDAQVCSPKQTYVEGATGMGPGTTWNTQPTMDGHVWNSDSYNVGTPCGTQGGVYNDITGLVQSWSHNGYPAPETIALRAANESDGTQFKQFYSADTYLAPHVDVTYVGPPGQVTMPTVYGAPNSIEVYWTAPSDGGAPISQYTVNVYSSPGGNFVTSGTSTSTSLTLSGNGIVDASTYTVTVTASNSYGSGLASPSSAVVRPPGCAAPYQCWGFDSTASPAQQVDPARQEYDAVDNNGHPDFYGGYVVGNYRLTTSDLSKLANEHVPVFFLAGDKLDQYANGNTAQAYMNGQADASAAINYITGPLGLFESRIKTVFADFENGDLVSPYYIEGFGSTLVAAGISPGYYLNPTDTSPNHSVSAYCSATASDYNNTIGLIDSSNPENLGDDGAGGSRFYEANAPPYAPATVTCGNTQQTPIIWQYAENNTYQNNPNEASDVDLNENEVPSDTCYYLS